MVAFSPQGSPARRRLEAVQSGITADKSEGNAKGLAFIGALSGLGLLAAIAVVLVRKARRIAAERRAAAEARKKAEAPKSAPSIAFVGVADDPATRNFQKWAEEESAKAAASADRPMVERLRPGMKALVVADGAVLSTIVDAVDRRGAVLSTETCSAVAAPAATLVASEGGAAWTADPATLTLDATTGAWRATSTGPGVRAAMGARLPCAFAAQTSMLGAACAPLSIVALGFDGFAALDDPVYEEGDVVDAAIDVDDGGPPLALSVSIDGRVGTGKNRRLVASFRSPTEEDSARLVARLLQIAAELRETTAPSPA
jgi:hypothetical protein